MKSLAITKWTIEISIADARRRFLQMLPAILSWGTLIGLALLSFVLPFWIAIFVIAYDLYALVRAVYMSIHLVYAYRRLRREASVDWIKRCRKVSGDLSKYRDELALELKQLPRDKSNRDERNRIKNASCRSSWISSFSSRSP